MTIKMAKPFPDMDYWGAFMAMGPAPLGKASDPPDYGRNPLSTGPYKVESFRPSEELVLVKNDQWDPTPTRPVTSTPTSGSSSSTLTRPRPTRSMLSGNTESQTAVATSVGSRQLRPSSTRTLGDRLVQQSRAVHQLLDARTTRRSPTSKSARPSRTPTPTRTSGWPRGEVPGVTRVPANSVMPPGMAGKTDYFSRR